MNPRRCIALLATLAAACGPHDADGSFGSDDLEALLRSGEAGIIYLWSPHMPFSVDGITAITAAAAARDLELTVLLHADSDRDYARETLLARSAAVVDELLRTLTAAELLQRGMTVHAPSIQLYADGRLVGPVLPGVRGVTGYLEFIDSFAQELSR